MTLHVLFVDTIATHDRQATTIGWLPLMAIFHMYSSSPGELPADGTRRRKLSSFLSTRRRHLHILFYDSVEPPDEAFILILI